jgi:hypothetical protein
VTPSQQPLAAGVRDALVAVGKAEQWRQVPAGTLRILIEAIEAQGGGLDHEHYWTDAPDDETGWHCTICGLTEYPGAEAAGEAATPLDVERLALALHEERADRWGGCGNPGEAYDDHMTFHQTRADRIAAEYARLSGSTDKEGRG